MSQRNPSSRKPRGKKPYSGGKTWSKDKTRSGKFTAKGDEVLKDGAFDSARNDWRWYATNPQLVKDSASYPYSYAVGSKLYFGPYGGDGNLVSLPGVCALRYVPTIGYSDNPNSPINVASRKIYSDIRHTNSGGVNYDPVDLMIYLVAMDSCYMILEAMKRVYGVMRLVSPINRYYPKALVTAMGVSYDSINRNLDDFRAAINTYAQKLKSLCIPNGMSYMAKHQWLATGIYQDHPTDKSQLYIFVPQAYFKFGLDSDGAGQLESIAWQTTTTDAAKTFEQCVQFMNDLLNPLLANQDFSIISGDILKWRGVGGVVNPSGITETYQVFPTYDASVLDQIQNATILGLPCCINQSGVYMPPEDSMMLRVKQDANKSYLVSKPWFRNPVSWNTNIIGTNPGRNAYLVKRFINFDHDGITPEETMEATRLTNIATEVVTKAIAGATYSYDWFKVPTLGSEALVSINFYWYEQLDDEWILRMRNISSISHTLAIQENLFDPAQAQIGHIAAAIQQWNWLTMILSAFNRHPYVSLVGAVGDTSGHWNTEFAQFQGYAGDIDYYCIVDVQDLTQMSEIALMSEFNVRME